MRHKLVVLVMLAGLAGPAGVIRDPLHDATREGRRLFEQKDYQAALEAFGRGREAAPDHPVLAFDIGDTLLRMGRHEEARQEFQKALRTDDVRLKSRVLYNLGNTSLAEKDYRSAVDYYRRSLLLDPTQADAKRNLELARQKQEQASRSQRQARKEGNQDRQSDSGQQARSDQSRQQSSAQRSPSEENRNADRRDGRSTDSSRPPEQRPENGQPSSRADQSRQPDSTDAANRPAASPHERDRRDQAGRPGETARPMSAEQARQLLRLLASQDKKQLQDLLKARAKSRATRKEGKDW